jgi:RNA polymerase sigma-70 factor (ECF subfamily)
MRMGEDDGTSGAAAKAAFDHQVVALIPSLLRLAGRLTGDPHVAEDVVQDALARAAKSWQTFRGEAKVSTWLTSIVVNVFRDRLTRAQRDRSTQSLEAHDVDRPVSRVRDPAHAAQDAEFGRIVAACVSRLPPRQREVLVLVAYEGMSGREAADALGVSEQNVRTSLHLARQKMREMLAPHVGEASRL